MGADQNGSVLSPVAPSLFGNKPLRSSIQTLKPESSSLFYEHNLDALRVPAVESHENTTKTMYSNSGNGEMSVTKKFPNKGDEITKKSQF